MKKLLNWSMLLLAAACAPVGSETEQKIFDIQGHRGARGLMPENSIPAFLKAIDLGVTTLEMDLAVTKDKKLVVSHEPYISADYCLDSTGEEISAGAQRKYNIYAMTYDEVRQFDCGSKPYPRFNEQQKMNVNKPLLTDVIAAVENYVGTEKRTPVNYNIEIKTDFRYDNIYHPSPETFSDLVFETLKSILPLDRLTIQSFDFRVLKYFHEIYPQVRLAQLIENDLLVKENLDSLGFNPDIYSPYYKLLDAMDVEGLHDKGILVIPWTVNTPEEMNQLRLMGVDGIITDYPDRVPEMQ